MKILLISSSSGSHGGGEFYLELLASGLVELGCEVITLMSDGSHMDGMAERISKFGDVVRIPLKNTYHRKTRVIGSILDRIQIAKIRSQIESIAPDVVHINKQCVDDGLGIVKAMQGSDIPCVVTIHVTRSMSQLGASMGKIRDWISLSVIRKSRLPIITVSERCGEDWKQIAGDANRVEVVPNGTTAASCENRDKFRRAWNISGADLVMGTVARIEEQKNPLFLVSILAQLPDHVHMVWIGDGRLRNELETEIEKHNVGERFHLLGWQDNAKQMICGFDLFVLPSLFEGFPFAILEAMSAGLPCVVSDVDGNGESVLHEQTGLVLPLNDTKKWQSGLQRLIDQPETRQQFGNAARARFDSEYDVSVMAKRTLEVYRRVAGNGSQDSGNPTPDS